MKRPIVQKTTEKVQKSISAAFDSVNLINKTITNPVTDKTKRLVELNYKHCELMLTKDWFVAGLQGTQKADIESSIASAKTYTV